MEEMAAVRTGRTARVAMRDQQSGANECVKTRVRVRRVCEWRSGMNAHEQRTSDGRTTTHLRAGVTNIQTDGKHVQAQLHNRILQLVWDA